MTAATSGAHTPEAFLPRRLECTFIVAKLHESIIDFRLVSDTIFTVHAFMTYSPGEDVLFGSTL